MRGKHPRLVAAVGVTTIALALGAPGTATAHGHPHAVPIKQAIFNAYATGTYLHTHLLQAENSRLVNANVAGSAAAVDSKGLARRADEMGRFVVNPEATGKISWGRGVAIEAGLEEDVPSGDPAIALAGVAKQAAPPTVGTPDVVDLLHLDLDPVLYNSAARGEAAANWNSEDPCIYRAPDPPTRFPLGPPPENVTADFGFGVGSVEDLELLDLDLEDEGQPTLQRPLLATNVTTGQGIKKRSTGWTSSQTYLAGQYTEGGKLLGPDYGLASEVRATLAPVTLFTGGTEGTEEAEGQTETTIEVLGPWRLVAAAGGLPNSAWIHFGPEDTEPNTPILRISTRSMQNGVLVEENDDVLTVEELTDPETGLLDTRTTIEGVAEIVLGEAPRAIGDESATSKPTEAGNGTRASAAADVLRIEVLEEAEPPGTELAEIRLGHMEVEAEVPEGGLSCVPPKLPSTGDDDVTLPQTGGDNVGTAVGAANALPAAGSDKSPAATGQVTEWVRAAGSRLPPVTRAAGLFSAVLAILVSSGALLLRRRWSRS